MENMKILVEIGYVDFEFKTIDEAMDFAKAALKSCVDDKKIRIEVTFEQEDE